MKRNRLARRTRKTPDMEPIVRLAQQMSLSSSQIEDNFWSAKLSAQINRLLADGDEEALVGALDHLYNLTGSNAYDTLAATIESCVESRVGESVGDLETLMIAIPVLAWSRFPIPSGAIPATTLDSLRVQLQAHVLAANTKLALCDLLLSPDQLPQTYVDTSQWLDRLAKAAVHERNLKLDPAQLGETVEFLSDARYLIAAVAAPKGSPLFRWQEDDGDPLEAFRQWATQGGEVLRALLPACALEFLPVRAFHAAIRDADRASRPWSLRAAVSFLQTVMNITPGQLRAIIAPFHDRQLEEYRIGFALRNDKTVVHGVVWPILEPDDEANDTPGQIEAVLKEAGISSIINFEQRFPLEFCDDCGSPLYPNPDGEPVHAELPEEQMESAPRHLH